MRKSGKRAKVTTASPTRKLLGQLNLQQVVKVRFVTTTGILTKLFDRAGIKEGK